MVPLSPPAGTPWSTNRTERGTELPPSLAGVKGEADCHAAEVPEGAVEVPDDTIDDIDGVGLADGCPRPRPRFPRAEGSGEDTAACDVARTCDSSTTPGSQATRPLPSTSPGCAETDCMDGWTTLDPAEASADRADCWRPGDAGDAPWGTARDRPSTRRPCPRQSRPGRPSVTVTVARSWPATERWCCSTTVPDSEAGVVGTSARTPRATTRAPSATIGSPWAAMGTDRNVELATSSAKTAGGAELVVVGTPSETANDIDGSRLANASPPRLPRVAAEPSTTAAAAWGRRSLTDAPNGWMDARSARNSNIVGSAARPKAILGSLSASDTPRPWGPWACPWRIWGRMSAETPHSSWGWVPGTSRPRGPAGPCSPPPSQARAGRGSRPALPPAASGPGRGGGPGCRRAPGPGQHVPAGRAPALRRAHPERPAPDDPRKHRRRASPTPAAPDALPRRGLRDSPPTGSRWDSLKLQWYRVGHTRDEIGRRCGGELGE